MAETYSIVTGYGGEALAEFRFDAEELRNIALALGYHDAGAQEMLRAADALDDENAAVTS